MARYWKELLTHPARRKHTPRLNRGECEEACVNLSDDPQFLVDSIGMRMAQSAGGQGFYCRAGSWKDSDHTLF